MDANHGLDKVADVMTKRQIRRVLVLWEDALYGVITARTILARMKEHLRSSQAQAAFVV